jgi:hypothetical protein
VFGVQRKHKVFNVLFSLSRFYATKKPIQTPSEPKGLSGLPYGAKALLLSSALCKKGIARSRRSFACCNVRCDSE